jgi:methyl-accepting chemotaxis protein
MFKNLKIGSRLTAAFALLMTLMLVIASISLLKLAGINDNMQLILKDRFAKTVEANKVIDNVNIIAISLRNMMLTSSAEDRLKQKERVFEARKNIASTIESLEKTLTSPQEKELLQTMLDTRKNYIAGQNKLIELIENSHPDEARASLT